MSKKKKDYEIISDRRTVWINHIDGSNIARFAALGGIDVHTSVTDQLAGADQCLFCKSGPASAEDWETFKQKVLEHYDIEVSDTHKPKSLRGAHASHAS